MKSSNLTFLYGRVFFLFVFSLFAVGGMAQTSIYDLRCENLHSPLGIDNTHPHFSWKLSSTENGNHQTAYEVQVATSVESLTNGSPDLWASGRVESDQSVMVDYEGKSLVSRDLCYWRVRVWDAQGEASDWSSVERFSIGILNNELAGSYIGAKEEIETKAPLVRKQLQIDTEGIVFVHVNSLGYHELYVNGQKATDHVLQPAVSQLDKRSLIVTYDVTPYIHSGSNDIVIWLGQGWYKNTVFKTQYNGPVVKAEIDQLGSDGWRTIASTGADWQVSASGYYDTGRWDGLGFGGERIDGAKNPHTLTTAELDERDWHSPRVAEIMGIAATPQMFGGNRIGETVQPVSVTLQSDGSWMVDMGKVFTGWLKVSFPNMKMGDGFRVEYTDHIMPGEGFQSQGEKDEYSSSGIPEHDVFLNKFHHHVIRYARITPFEEALGEEALARGVSLRAPVTQKPEVAGFSITGTEEETSTFSCNDEDINQIHDMIHRTVENLTFSGYMVDCPHLERQGYGGDGNASIMTLQTMYNTADTYYNWMQAWSDVMDDNGSLPYVAPAGGGGGGPFWCEFFVKAPWRTFLNYGDKRLLERYYDQARKWMDYVESWSKDNLLTPWPDTQQRIWWLGDWLAPNGVDADSETTKGLVNNCVVSDACQTMMKMASVLGKEDDRQAYEEKANAINRAIRDKYHNRQAHTVGAATPLDMSYALLTGVVPENEREAVVARLLSLQKEKYKSHIAVGLVGVPVFTEWATQQRQADMMMTLLKKRDYPGYLYMIDNNATATWEEWGGSRSHLHNCYNGIGTWFYQALAGLIPDETQPGYKHFFIDPQCPDGITHVKMSKPTPFGPVVIEWTKEKEAASISYRIDVPVGATATLVGRHDGMTENMLLQSGHHEVNLPFVTSIHEQKQTHRPNTRLYNIVGQQVDSQFKGIVINNGRKEIRK